MMTGGKRGGGRKVAISDDELLRLNDEGISYSEIARRVGVSAQAISERARRLRATRADREEYLLPWGIRHAHTTGWVYRSAVAYAKRRRGEVLTDRQRKEGSQLEKFLHENQAVLAYDYNRGFYLRNRRPDDGPSMLVKE